MSTDFTLTGLAELQKAMETLPAKIEGRIMRQALLAGQKVILKQAKANINNRTGDLSKSLRIKTRSSKGKVSANLIAGDKKAFYAHMVERGTVQHFIKPKTAKSLFFAGVFGQVIDHPGAAKHAFMRPALDSESGRAIEAVRDYVAKRLPKEIKKAGL